MANLKELRDERLRKLDQLKGLGVNPYPAKTNRTNYIKDIIEDFDKFVDKEVSLVGRIVNIRKFGKLAFVVIKDESSKIQLFMEKSQIEEIDVSKDSSKTGTFISIKPSLLRNSLVDCQNKLRLLKRSLTSSFTFISTYLLLNRSSLLVKPS